MDMVERVARAIYKAHSIDRGTAPHTAEEEAEDFWPFWVADARAAIAAMREPTLEMAEAADAAMRMKVAEGPKRLGTLRLGYMAMIAAALTSSEPQAPSSE